VEREKEFQETEIGRIPKEWEVVRLGEIVTLRNGKRPKLSQDGGFPVYGANGIMGNSEDFLVDSDYTLVIGRVGASGEVQLGTGKIWVSDNAIYSESYLKERVYLPFLYHLLVLKRLSDLATKTTHPLVTQSLLAFFPLPLPPLPEQKKIAEILRTVDEAIEKTDEAIEGTKRLKKGLMRELFEKGAILGFMFDTNIFNHILDRSIDLDALPRNFRYFVTHIQEDEIEKTKEKYPERWEELRKIFVSILQEKIATESFALNISRLGHAKLSDGVLYDRLLSELEKLDRRTGKKHNNVNKACDVLIAETCIKNGLILVSNDENLREVIRANGGWAISLDQFLRGEYREFQETEIGRIPKEWRVVRLGEVCETQMGGTPSTKVAEYWEPAEIPWITPEDMEKGQLNRVSTSKKLISRLGLEKSSAKLFPPNTVLLSTTATIGKVGIAERPLSANQQISGVVCKKELHPEFLAYYLLVLGEAGLKQLGGTVTATHINQRNLRSLSIPLPPLPEQKKIAEILYTMDRKIELLRKRKEILERLKKGLMGDLLTGKVRVKKLLEKEVERKHATE